jgi:LPXTG-motif cell wall-anchored protein
MFRSIGGVTTLVIGGILAAAPLAGTASAAEAGCTSTTYSWSGDQLMVYSSSVEFHTGVVVPSASAGETLVVADATYHVYDKYPDDSSPNRVDSAQTHEQMSLTVGGVQIGGLTPDLPNGVAEGAPTDWYSGERLGSFGSGQAITGGELVLHHSSQFGFTESPNSLHAAEVSVTIEACVTVASTVPVTVASTVAPTSAPTTVVSTEAPAVAVAPTPVTSPAVTSTVPASTSTTVAAVAGPAPSAAPTSTINPLLPATGAGTVVPLIVGGVAVCTGASLMLVRRRPRR